MESIPIEFFSEGECVRGRFFPSTGTKTPTTLLLVPGWPGNPNDVLGLGSVLSAAGINVCMFNPRGLHQSEGTASHANTLKDIGNAWKWLKQTNVHKRFKVYADRVVLGGYSFGAGMALAYAAQDPSVSKVVSIAGPDFGEVGRLLQHDPAFNASIRQSLWSTRAPQGPARFDVEAITQEIIDHPEIYGLKENAMKLADLEILLIGGWDDEESPIELFNLPLYRALKLVGAKKVTLIVYHTNHEFNGQNLQLATDIAEWMQRKGNG